jgi:hypothetical protein
MENATPLTPNGLIATATFHEFIAAENVEVKWVSSNPDYATAKATDDGNISTALVLPVDKTAKATGVSVIIAMACNPQVKGEKNQDPNAGKVAVALTIVGDPASLSRMSMTLTPVPAEVPVAPKPHAKHGHR